MTGNGILYFLAILIVQNIGICYDIFKFTLWASIIFTTPLSHPRPVSLSSFLISLFLFYFWDVPFSSQFISGKTYTIFPSERGLFHLTWWTSILSFHKLYDFNHLYIQITWPYVVYHVLFIHSFVHRHLDWWILYLKSPSSPSHWDMKSGWITPALKTHISCLRSGTVLCSKCLKLSTISGKQYVLKDYLLDEWTNKREAYTSNDSLIKFLFLFPLTGCES